MLMIMHGEVPFEREAPGSESVGPACRSFSEYPNMPVLSINEFVVIKGPCRNYDKVFIDEHVLHVGIRHESVLGSKHGCLSNDPIVLVEIIAVTEYNLQIIVEAKSVYSKSIHIHADFEERSYFYPLVGCQP